MHVLFAFGVLLCAAQAQEFNYDQHGADWEGLCATGSSQSPISIRRPTRVSDVYQPLVVANADSVEYTVSEEVDTYRLTAPQPASTLTAVLIGESAPTTFTLNNIHFHSTSEHRVRGQVFDLEMHMVHYGPNGARAVLGVFYYISYSRSPLLDSVMQGGALNIAAELGSTINDFYFYSGSLTTPPCTEPVNWFLPRFGSEVGLSATQDQIDWVAGQWDQNQGYARNNRQTQPLNGRTVYEFIAPDSTSYLNSSS